MYDLPSNPSARDVILRSLTCHPTLFADAMADVAKVHADAASIMDHHIAKVTAQRLASAARTMDIQARTYATNAALGVICRSGMDYWVTALNVASRLQCLPRPLISEAAERGV